MINHGVLLEEVGEWNGINRKPVKKYVVVLLVMWSMEHLHHDVFLSRVYRDTADDDMRCYISSKGVNGVDLTLVSNVNSTFQSYKLSVPIVEKHKILQASLSMAIWYVH